MFPEKLTENSVSNTAALIRQYYNKKIAVSSDELRIIEEMLRRQLKLPKDTDFSNPEVRKLFDSVLSAEERQDINDKKNLETGRTIEIFSYFVLIPAIGFMLINTGPAAGLTEIFGLICLILFFVLQFTQSLFTHNIALSRYRISAEKQRGLFKISQGLCIAIIIALVVLLRKWILQILKENRY